MIQKALVFTVITWMASTAYGHEVNFQQLANCYSWTNLGLRSSEMQSFRTSQYIGNVSHGTSANADVNALVMRLSNPDRVAVIQNEGGTIYPATNSAIRSECSRNRTNGGMVLPVRGFLNAGEESSNLNPTYIRVQTYAHRGRQSGTEMCHINSASARLNPTGVRGTAMSDEQIEATVRQAVLERLQWVAQNAASANNRAAMVRNFESALNPGGACFKVLPMFSGLDSASTAALCAVNPNPGPECQPAATEEGTDPEARP